MTTIEVSRDEYYAEMHRHPSRYMATLGNFTIGEWVYIDDQGGTRRIGKRHENADGSLHYFLVTNAR